MYEATIIIPTKNEEKTIGKVINDIRKLRKNYEIIVIDKSTDLTPVICKKLGVKVIKQRTLGKGNAMKMGVNFAKSDIIVFIDGDGTYPVYEIPKMIKIIKSKNIDLVRACRLKKWKQRNLINLFMNKILSIMASILYLPTSDLLTGMYSIKKNCFKSLNLKSGGFEIETELFVKAVKRSLNIREIQIEYLNRIGKTKFRKISDTLKIIMILLCNIWK
ncbi:MAG: glycosyltransferase [Candidatus Parvarchaeota archaeon]|nr:glycosyltransferase [Candidatus Jingweiarchaeum tengchongense]MCW1310745.1 glycosyltransferase [Candidatus Jingweiarchaeum tengchongense]